MRTVIRCSSPTFAALQPPAAGSNPASGRSIPRRGLISLGWLAGLWLAPGLLAQTVFLDFNTVGQYTNSFNPWNDAGGSNANNYCFAESSGAGVVLGNLPAANVQADSATLSGQVTSTGGETPTVVIYYGPSDGGTNGGSWANNVSVGSQSGLFRISVGGLVPNATYYFAAAALNSAGAAWATPSLSFHTPGLTLPQIANSTATNVQATLATLNGQVLSSGGDVPDVTVFYGPADGGSNPAAWASSIDLGLQNGAFAQTVLGLAPNTTYFFTARAVNGAGAAWAAPSASFTTRGADTAATLVAVLTQHNDNARTGMNLQETELTTATVNTNQFGLLYTRPVDDQVYAQPLIATNVNLVGNGTHNLLIVATVNDTLYAYDADDPTVTAPYWQKSLLVPNSVAPQNVDMTLACGGSYHDFSGRMGIVAAPVIDPASGTLYVLARTKEYNTNFVQRLHALDLKTGQERANSPVIIAATNGVAFDPYKQNPRAGLLLANGYVYMCWASHCDWGPYHGWVIGYNATNFLQAPVTYNATPSGSMAGVWMSNQGPVADTNGNVFLSTGNGTFDGASNFGESFLKLTRSGGSLALTSWFTPYNWNSLNGSDADLGSGGLLLIPGTSLLFGGGKAGVLYLVNKDNMGGLSGTTADTNIVQSWSLGGHSLHGGAVWWDCPAGAFAYIWGASSDHLRQYQFNRTSGQFPSTTPYAQSVTVGGSGQPGGLLALSANSTNSGSGIVWAAINTSANANQSVVAGTLHAYNAQNVATELWNSDMLSSRDSLDNFAKFVAPTVANGKVYMATFSNRINVYGVFPRPSLSTAFQAGSIVLSWTTNYSAGYLLQASPSLSPTAWTNVAGITPGVTNGQYQVALPATGAMTFYRLKR